jgi:hypothetical protein
MKFSKRYGYVAVRELIQVESMDEPLRNGLWSLLSLSVWDHVSKPLYSYTLVSSANRNIKALCVRLWLDYFKRPLDTLSDHWKEVIPALRKHFFECSWYEVYDFVEFIANNYERPHFRDIFIKSVNDLLEREVSAYRFVGSKITRITEREQIEEIEEALQSEQGPVRIHLQRALELLVTREAPDYRNSIKESICAIESLVASSVNVDKGTLGQLIKKLEDEIGLHPALSKAFSNLYGYTCDHGGIRHALMEAEKVDFDDAKFMLVVCSAFVNFVKGKVQTKE